MLFEEDPTKAPYELRNVLPNRTRRRRLRKTRGGKRNGTEARTTKKASERRKWTVQKKVA